jgi:acetoin utilization deacetylase AcuC-like enzyme
MATGWVWHERYAWHDTGHGAGALPVSELVEPEDHVESPASKRRFRNLVEVSGLLERLVPIPPRMATEEELLRFHTPEYVARIRELSASGGGRSDVETHVGRGSYEIALLAAGGCMEAVDAVLDGRVGNAYALVRPPGHHAGSDGSCGFCIFGNTALAAMHARDARGLSRVAVVDWDVHHGNGTEEAFYGDPSVLTISLHQDNNFPVGSGKAEHEGAGEGEGYNINVPLPPGSGEGAYVAAFERIVAPALRAHRPELVLLASGFDASALDPLGRQMLHSEAYRRLARIFMDVAEEVCGGRIVACHEGGYSTSYVPFCGLAVVEELSGVRTGVEDPFLAELRSWAYHDLQPHQDAVIAALEGRASRLQQVTKTGGEHGR